MSWGGLRVGLGLAALLAVVALAAGARAQTDTGWIITSARIEIDVTAEGVLEVRETWAVDFGGLEKHGIFRDLITTEACAPADEADAVNCPAGRNRVYPVDVRLVTADGAGTQWEVLREGRLTRIKIGYPSRTVHGEHTYFITYTLRGALNQQPEHDELFWNVVGEWPVPISAAEVTVRLPQGARLATECYEGPAGSRARCQHGAAGNVATYRSRGVLEPYEQISIVAGWQKGLVTIPPSVLHDPVTFGDFFTLDAWEWGGMGAVGAVAVAGVAGLWWRFGRDRAYKSLYYLTNNPEEGRRPLFARRDVVVEFLPPDDLKPAQMGVLLDERADTLDVTATIIDLAVRGYLKITEVQKKGWFGKRDWELRQMKTTDDGLLPWEAQLLKALVDSDGVVKVSNLKNSFYKDLEKTTERLYEDALARKWFRIKPETLRNIWSATGLGVAVVGALVAWGVGFAIGRTLIFAPLVVGGLLLLVLAGAMPRRTAVGSEALRRILGFRLYVATAEKRMQEFNEQQNIFARYLPYAMVFGCVEKWAKAFENLGMKPEDAGVGWYSGVHAFNAATFSNDMRGFSSSLSTAISSSPGGSGGSGFGGGGSSGGGGGGGGGGSW